MKYDTTSADNLYMFNSPTSSGTVFYQPIYRVVRSSNTSGMSTNFIYLKGSDMGNNVQNLTSYQTSSVKQALTTLLGIVNRLSFAIEAKLISCDEVKFFSIKEKSIAENQKIFSIQQLSMIYLIWNFAEQNLARRIMKPEGSSKE